MLKCKEKNRQCVQTIFLDIRGTSRYDTSIKIIRADSMYVVQLKQL